MVLPLLKKAETQGTRPAKEYFKTAEEMAELLGISVRTVESYRENIRKI
jgi:hypothetical protein